MKAGLVRSLLAGAFVIGASGFAHATQIERVTFSGNQAQVEFMGSASLTCADGSSGMAMTIGFMFSSEQMQVSSSGDFSSNGTFVELAYMNSCTGVSTGFADGGINGGFTPPDKKLTSAAIDGSTLVQDFGSGIQISFSAAVDIEGTGQISASKGSSKSTISGGKGGPITMTVSHSSNSNRSGTASGTITVDGIDMNAEFSTAFLSINDSAQLTANK